MLIKMNFSKIKLPSNKNFGFFFSIIFFVAAIYCLYIYFLIAGYIFITLSVLFLSITLINDNLLLPLNKLWMSFGLLLGKIISPIILGIIFFGLFTPYGIILRLIGRDELNLKLKKTNSYWKHRVNNLSQTNFNKQF